MKIADGIHDKCPKLQCRSTLIALDNGLYRSQKCDNDYFLASTGIRLTLDISPTDVLKGKVIIFNELAEQLLGKTSIQLANMREGELIELEQLIMKKKYKFIIGPGRNDSRH